MQQTTEDVRRDIVETRQRVTQVLAELNDEVTGRRDAVRQRVAGARDAATGAASQVPSAIADFAREHPWSALGAALGIGALIGRSGADVAAARGAADGAARGARGVAGAAAGAAKAAADRAKGMVNRGGAGEDPVAVTGTHSLMHDPATGAIGSSAEDTGQVEPSAGGGILARVKSGVFEAIGGNELVAEMRRAAEGIR